MSLVIKFKQYIIKDFEIYNLMFLYEVKLSFIILSVIYCLNEDVQNKMDLQDMVIVLFLYFIFVKIFEIVVCFDK